MAKEEPKKKPEATDEEPRTFAIMDRGVRTDDDFTNAMSALMSDLIRGRIAPNVGNATCNAGGKLLKMVEMKYRYGTTSRQGTPKTLVLAPIQCANCGATIAGNAIATPEEKAKNPELCEKCKSRTLDAPPENPGPENPKK